MNDRRMISYEEGEKFARENNLDCFIETSAKTGEKIEEVSSCGRFLLADCFDAGFPNYVTEDTREDRKW